MKSQVLRVAIVGASGYAGGELLRLLLGHPQVVVAQATSESHVGEYVYQVHPNLRKHRALMQTPLQFTSVSALERCDLLFLALPHGAAQQQIERFAGLAGRIIDLSADFRLRDPATYARWYGHAHQAPAWLDRFVYGLPEVNRAAIRGAHYVSGVGCNATASLLALLPLAQAGLIDPARPVVVEVKAGSSEGGNSPSLASHHPERAGAVRSFAPTGHRHTGEVSQALGLENVHLSVTSIELVRGVLATAHVWPARHLEPIRKKGGAAFPGCPGGLESPPHDFSDRFLTDKELWQAYRAAYRDEPFVRIVHERGGIYRHPEPKILAGSNYADVGWALDEATGRVVALCAIDNLMKGAAGSAIQCMNLMLGLEETMGLEFPGLHPV